MNRVFVRSGVAAALGSVLLTSAASVALADPPGYYFQDSDMQPSLNTAGPPAHINPPGVAGKQQGALTTAQDALQLAQRALNQAQQALQAGTAAPMEVRH
jgi:hypothetical protein